MPTYRMLHRNSVFYHFVSQISYLFNSAFKIFKLGSFIYAVLITTHKPLSAEEIGERTNYAYSSTINYLNTLIRLGLVERFREFRKNRYVANVNFVELIKAERERVKSYLKQLGSDIEGIKDLEPLRDKVESAIAYLKGIERVVNIKEE
ncbi:MAG TPA: hypothetical protein EYP28_05275 [Methanophagales archaeon]|nr:hypothetical protein [Methanophagales archaeon]